MRVTITDACIFIELHDLKLTNLLFSLKVDIHTSYDVYNELYHNQQDILTEFHTDGKLTLHNISGKELEIRLKLWRS